MLFIIYALVNSISCIMLLIAFFYGRWCPNAQKSGDSMLETSSLHKNLKMACKFIQLEFHTKHIEDCERPCLKSGPTKDQRGILTDIFPCSLNSFTNLKHFEIVVPSQISLFSLFLRCTQESTYLC